MIFGIQNTALRRVVLVAVFPFVAMLMCADATLTLLMDARECWKKRS